jgi:hypothetical protein
VTRSRSDRWKPALLSALVFPGLGQLARRRYAAGLACAGSSLLLLAVLFRRVWVEAQARMPTDPNELLSRLLDEPGWPVRLAAEIQRDNASFFLWLTLAIVIIWALSVWDAWRDAGRTRP